jgi:hypothetical protein
MTREYLSYDQAMAILRDRLKKRYSDKQELDFIMETIDGFLGEHLYDLE